MHVCVGPRLILEVFDDPPSYSFGAGSLLWLLLLASLFWDTLSLPSEWYRWATMPTWHFHGYWGPELYSASLHDRQALYSGSSLLSPSGTESHTVAHVDPKRAIVLLPQPTGIVGMSYHAWDLGTKFH